MVGSLVALTLSVLALLACVGSVLGLPGNWLIVALAAGCWYWPAPEWTISISGQNVLVLLALACCW